MKQMILITLFMTYTFAGFFNETASADKAEFIENDRLCKVFQKKVEDYKKTMRSDFLAATTLASYEHRASLFCKKADDVKEDLTPEVLSELNVTAKINIPDINSTEVNTTDTNLSNK